MTTQNSPLPWYSEHNKESRLVFIRSNPEFESIASLRLESGHDAITNAQFICTAVNAHAALVASLQECVTEPFAHCLVNEDKDALYRRVCAINDIARAALLGARGQK
jgi:hypothetical protein